MPALSKSLVKRVRSLRLGLASSSQRVGECARSRAWLELSLDRWFTPSAIKAMCSYKNKTIERHCIIQFLAYGCRCDYVLLIYRYYLCTFKYGQNDRRACTAGSAVLAKLCRKSSNSNSL